MLSRIRKAMDENEEGFTLIELLVVIIIIGILAAIAIPVFLNQRKKAVDSSMKSDLRTIANEMETYFTDAQIYPADVSTAVATQTATIETGATDVTVKLSAGNNVDLVAVAGAPAGTYCLNVVNSNGSGTTYYYDSDGGGLRNTVCTA